MDNSDRALNTILGEHKVICDQIKDMVSYSDKVLTIFITITGTVFVYGIKEGEGIVIVVASFLAIIIILFNITMNSAILSLGGYRLYLEEMMNKLNEKQLIHWERVVTCIFHRSLSIRAFQFFASLLLLIILYYGIMYAQSLLAEKPILLVINFLYVSGCISIFISFVSLKSRHKKAYLLAKSIKGEEVISEYESAKLLSNQSIINKKRL